MDWWARRISVCAEDTEQSILLCAQPSQPTVASQPASQPVQHRTEQHSTVTSSRSLATLLTPSLSLQQRSKYTRGGGHRHTAVKGGHQVLISPRAANKLNCIIEQK